MKRGQKTRAEQVVLKLRQIEVQTAQGKSLALTARLHGSPAQSRPLRSECLRHINDLQYFWTYLLEIAAQRNIDEKCKRQSAGTSAGANKASLRDKLRGRSGHNLSLSQIKQPEYSITDSIDPCREVFSHGPDQS